MSYTVTFPGDSYDDALDSFEWDVPEDYNAARDLVGKHADADDRVALYQGYPDGRRQTFTFHDVDVRSNQVANAFEGLGIGRGDRVAVMLPQKPENLLAHVACWKMGAISVPLSVLFGDQALRYRLNESESTVLVVDGSVLDVVDAVRDDCPDLAHVIVVDGEPTGEDLPFEAVRRGESESYDLAETGPDTPATITYTSGSTGAPKGALHSHDGWIGGCPAYAMYFGEGDVEANVVDDAILWTPGDWAWVGSLGTTIFPSWHYGRPVVGYPMGKFDPERAFEILEEFGVTHTNITATAVRMMMNVESPLDRYDLDLRAISVGGEPVTEEIHRWGDDELDGVLLNESYGQTETMLFVGNCQAWFEAKPGSMGKRAPGRRVKLLDTVSDPADPEEVPPGEMGEIVVHRDDPGCASEYWNKPEKTAAASVGDWHRTGDLAVVDEEGYFWYESRIDGVILTSGYRVSPPEVEDVVLDVPEVEQVGVIGVPHETRNEVIKAFVKPKPGVSADAFDDLRERIERRTRERLAKYEYPREIEFVDDLPQTVTGKVKRDALRERESE